jgi:membrane associated rhomboid family serine protease
VSGIYGIVAAGQDTDQQWRDPNGNSIPSPKEIFGYLSLVAGILAALAGLLGYLAGYFKTCCSTSPLMIVSLLIFPLMLIVSILGFILYDLRDDQ